MIEKAEAKDLQQIYRIYKEAFSFDDNGSIDHYFRYYYDPANCSLIRNGEQIACIAMTNKHTLLLHERRVEASLISGVATIPSYRRQGLMSILLRELLEELSAKELVTLIQAYHPEYYEPFGFAMTYRKNKYLFSKAVKAPAGYLVSNQFQVEELWNLYHRFTAHFTGYSLRTLEQFRKYILGVKAEGGSILVCRNPQRQLIGYAMTYPQADVLRAEELIYADFQVLLVLVNAMLERYPQAEIWLSRAENLSKFLPEVKMREEGFMMARINDYHLFNRLFSSKVNSIEGGFALSNKPLYLTEYY
ncbi:MAG: GNAT family N-acetyltransferase [Erysipelotrichaceae bacterium]|nr:GNAT family N-acetyltransferase [Erysipelotrichaceae bacterium]